MSGVFSLTAGAAGPGGGAGRAAAGAAGATGLGAAAAGAGAEAAGALGSVVTVEPERFPKAIFLPVQSNPAYLPRSFLMKDFSACCTARPVRAQASWSIAIDDFAVGEVSEII